MRATLTALALTLYLAPAALCAPFDPVTLPQPTGAHPVGTVTYAWEDATRSFSYSSFAGDRRKIVVQIWFPAEPDDSAAKAPYAALSADYRHVEGRSTLSPAFSESVTRAPLVLISPGRGVERFGYTTIAEDLASHGYVVAAVDMPGIGYVIYPDGYVARPDPRFRPSRELMSGPYEEVDRFFEEPAEIGRRDLELALQNLRALAESDPAGRFVGKIDFANLGIFGHSLGGRIAGAFAEQNAGVRAYISMEGIAPRRARLAGLEIPIAMMCSSGTLPYAKDNYQSLIDGRRREVFMIEMVGFGHNSVTDFPLATPSQFSYEIEPLEGLETSARIVRLFFDAYLRGEGDYLESTSDLNAVVITKHPAPRAEAVTSESPGTALTGDV